ncbi:hypothetical protein ACROYT_G019440 [Oculina patagonica]
MAVFSMVFITALLTIPNWNFLAAFNELESEDYQRSGYFHIIEGFSLFDHILSTHYTESSIVCGFLCLRNEHCISFNFGRSITSDGNFPCELSNSNANQSSMNLKRRSAFNYFSFLNFCQDRSLCHSRSPAVSPSVRCPLEIAVLPYIDDHCNVDKSFIWLRKGERNITEITTAIFKPLNQSHKYSFNFTEAKSVCEILDGSLASLEQMQAAFDNGFQECRYGWLAEGMTVVPMQEYRQECLGAGLNPSTNVDKGLKYDAYCVGVDVP